MAKPRRRLIQYKIRWTTTEWKIVRPKGKPEFDLEALPTELQIEVASYLHHHDLVSLACATKHWNRIATPVLYRDIRMSNLEDFRLIREAFENGSKSVDNVRRVRIACPGWDTNSFSLPYNSCCWTEAKIVQECERIADMHHLFARFTRVREIELITVEPFECIEVEAATSLSSYFGHMNICKETLLPRRSLKLTLPVSWYSIFANRVVNWMLQSNARTLRVEGLVEPESFRSQRTRSEEWAPGYGDDSPSEVLEPFRDNLQVTELSLRHFQISPSSLCEVLCRCQHLTRLSLAGIDFDYSRDDDDPQQVFENGVKYVIASLVGQKIPLRHLTISDEALSQNWFFWPDEHPVSRSNKFNLFDLGSWRMLSTLEIIEIPIAALHTELFHSIRTPKTNCTREFSAPAVFPAHLRQVKLVDCTYCDLQQLLEIASAPDIVQLLREPSSHRLSLHMTGYKHLSIRSCEGEEECYGCAPLRWQNFKVGRLPKLRALLDVVGIDFTITKPDWNEEDGSSECEINSSGDDCSCC